MNKFTTSHVSIRISKITPKTLSILATDMAGLQFHNLVPGSLYIRGIRLNLIIVTCNCK